MRSQGILLVAVIGTFLVACASRTVQADTTGTSPKSTNWDIVPTPTPTMVPSPPSMCPITAWPDDLFVPPEPYPATPPELYVSHFWYGTPELWTMLREDGTWYFTARGEPHYTQKIFWWRQGYSPQAEPEPELLVTARRLDAPGETFSASGATNATADFGAAMLIGVDIPNGGCWEITGHYKGHDLSFVVWVGP